MEWFINNWDIVLAVFFVLEKLVKLILIQNIGLVTYFDIFS